MFESIPSKCMRQYIEENHIVFSDFQKATLIWALPVRTREEKIEALIELADKTKDLQLIRQIHERIRYEELLWKNFIDNSERNSVYAVEAYEENWVLCGIFGNSNAALEYARDYCIENEVECMITKQKILEEKNEKIALETSVDLDVNGKILKIWVLRNGNLDRETEKFEENLERFENKYFRLPYPFRAGSVVKDIYTGRCGILAESQEDWEKSRALDEKRETELAFYYNSANVYFLQEDGCWCHEHMNPMHLDLDMLPIDSDDEKEQVYVCAMLAMSSFFGGKISEEQAKLVIRTSAEYAQICQEEKLEHVSSAEELSDIIV